MKVLLYNFLQPGESGKQGGGVAVYQANLMQALKQRGVEVVFLSSGDRYALLRSDPHLVAYHNGGDRAVIVNSPVLAPAHFTFYQIEAYTGDPGLDAIPAGLKARYGAIDAFHFQNVEGLTAGFFRALRAAYPDASILLSAHNYNIVCPQVNLWFREQRVCTDYRDGRACVNCLPGGDPKRHERNIRRMDMLLKRLGVAPKGTLRNVVTWTIRAPLRLRRRLKPRPHAAGPAAPIVLTSDGKSERYAQYRKTNLALCRDVFDRVLAVSDRTRRVLIQRGVPAGQVAVSYIGTAHYEHFLKADPIRSVGDGLHIGYLGYMRADKGFYFLLESLEYLDEHTARDLRVTIAAPVTDLGAVERLKAMAHKFRALTIHDGYTHATLDTVLAGVNLGVVPVLWEDNLPQVAIEMVSRGIPIITSNRGGAQEIAQNSAFTFDAGSHRDICLRWEEISRGRLPLDHFWDNPPRMVSMEAHVDELMKHYRTRRPPVAAPDLAPAAARSA
jgi:glycosyltransferase involved in cell wall biosynthesis